MTMYTMRVQGLLTGRRFVRTALVAFLLATAAVMVFAGLLATTSSANASIMAASRINLAMARDQMIPQWLNEIHPKRLTPYRAILMTGIVALLVSDLPVRAPS